VLSEHAGERLYYPDQVPRLTRDFLRLWAGQTISEIGSRITREGLPLTAVIVLGVSPVQIGVLAASGSASVLLFSMVAGVIADRVRRRPLMIAADLARAALLLSVPLAAKLGRLTFTELLAVAILAGLLTVQFDVAYQSYLPVLVSREDLFQSNRRLTMSSATAEILGPGLTGVLIQILTAPIAILFDSMSFIVSAVSVWMIRAPEPAPLRMERESLWREASEGARVIAAHPALRPLALRSAFTFFAMGFLFSGYLIYAIRVLHMNTATLGFVIALGGAGALLGAYVARRLRGFHAGHVFIASALIHALAQGFTPLAAYTPRFAAISMGIAQFVGDGAFTVYYLNETTLRQTLVQDSLLGRVNGAMQLASRGVLPLGALAGGVLAERIGLTNTIWLGAAGVLASCAFLMPLRRITWRAESQAAAAT
jgi:predicted MFS family arabinose efflux permease